MNAASRLVQLQVNTNGAWKTVLKFDDCELGATPKVMEACQMLDEVGNGVAFRIATCERVPQVVLYMGKSTYGLWMTGQSAPKGAQESV